MTTTDQPNSQDLHRRETRRQILLPFAGGVVLVVALLIGVIVAGRVPASAAANLLLTVLVLCPLAICLLPLYFLLVVAIAGMSRAHSGIAAPLRRVEDLSAGLRDRTKTVTERAARMTITLNARFAPLDKTLFSLFDRPAPDEDDHE